MCPVFRKEKEIHEQMAARRTGGVRLDQSMAVRKPQFRFRAEAAPLAQVQPITNYRITGTPQETHLGALATSMGLVS